MVVAVVVSVTCTLGRVRASVMFAQGKCECDRHTGCCCGGFGAGAVVAVVVSLEVGVVATVVVAVQVAVGVNNNMGGVWFLKKE